MNGIIFDIKRFAVHDGPGIRTTVFMKGCPLSCRWCHNPESMNSEICKVAKTVRIGEKSFTEDEPVGREMTVTEVLKELDKEKVFMEESGGGVTFSGGEPLFQHDFLIELLIACHSKEMHTTVDTCGYADWKVLEKVARHTDLFLYDLKLMDSGLHKINTGVPNKLILDNLSKLLETVIPVRIRVPLIPEITFTTDNIKKTIVFLKSLKSPVQGIDLLPYHNTASHKYERFGMDNSLKDLKSLNKAELSDVQLQFEEAGFTVKIGG